MNVVSAQNFAYKNLRINKIIINLNFTQSHVPKNYQIQGTVYRAYFNALIILEDAMHCKNKNFRICG